jgi:hypothetical protein
VFINLLWVYLWGYNKICVQNAINTATLSQATALNLEWADHKVVLNPVWVDHKVIQGLAAIAELVD